MKVFFSAGEASGDTYASLIAQEMAKTMPVSDMAGIGGSRLASVGVRLLASSATWGAIGVVQSLKVAPRIALAYRSVISQLAKEKPGLLIPIDFGFLNIRLARWAKERGWKVLYFIPPGSWRKDRQGSDLPKLCDHIVTPFPWSADLLRDQGAQVSFWGHPLAEMVERAPDASVRTGLALLPGSRMHEVQQNLPVLAGAANRLEGPFRFAVSPSLDKEDLMRRWQKLGGPEASFEGSVAEILKASRAAVVCSGTATLESALCLCPCVVIYKLSRMMALEAMVLRPKFEFISLPNILAGRRIVEELIHKDATVQNLTGAVEAIWQGQGRAAQLTNFVKLKHELAGSNVFAKTASMARRLLPR